MTDLQFPSPFRAGGKSLCKKRETGEIQVVSVWNLCRFRVDVTQPCSKYGPIRKNVADTNALLLTE
jgi:hypothetical protein